MTTNQTRARSYLARPNARVRIRVSMNKNSALSGAIVIGNHIRTPQRYVSDVVTRTCVTWIYYLILLKMNRRFYNTFIREASVADSIIINTTRC